MRGEKTLAAQIEDGTARVKGNKEVLTQLASTMVTFELGFEILPGTKGAAEQPKENPFEVDPGDMRGE